MNVRYTIALLSRKSFSLYDVSHVEGRIPSAQRCTVLQTQNPCDRRRPSRRRPTRPRPLPAPLAGSGIGGPARSQQPEPMWGHVEPASPPGEHPRSGFPREECPQSPRSPAGPFVGPAGPRGRRCPGGGLPHPCVMAAPPFLVHASAHHGYLFRVCF